MIKLGVNIDHVATLRQARQEGIPDLMEAAHSVKAGGADGITIHLREDRRHIQDSDLYMLVKDGPLPINLEMAPYDEIVSIALETKPKSVCLVPEKRQELTTEGGLDVIKHSDVLEDTIDFFKNAGIEVSLFIDPDINQIEIAHKLKTDAIELHTGCYANASDELIEAEYTKLQDAAKYALSKNIKVNAGHGLDYENVTAICDIEGLSELNIGYSIICRSIFVGLERAVREMKSLIES